MSILKNKIRNTSKLERSSISSSLKKEMDTAINTRLVQLVKEVNIHKIHLYIPMGDEIDIKSFIQFLLDDKKEVYTSESLKKGQLRHWRLHSLDELRNGIYGTQFPKNSQQYCGNYDMIIVPGLAFTQQGDRIGYGAGYYDRFLANHQNALKVGVCYPFQIFAELPIEPFDIQLDSVVSS